MIARKESENMTLKYLIYRATPTIGGGELIATFQNKEDAEMFLELIRSKTKNLRYYLKKSEW